MKKPAIPSFDFIRSICALGITIYHFSCHFSDRSFLPLHTFANGNWGGILVTAFFMLSGASLYYQYEDKLQHRPNRKLYFYKRWLSVFPMYYLAYCIVEIILMFQKKNILFRGNPLIYVFTILGMDGYFKQFLPTAHSIGEWFSGAIIILYILFPLLLQLFKKSPAAVFSAVAALYLITLDRRFLCIYPFQSIPSCLISFVCGMVFMKNRYLFDSCAMHCRAYSAALRCS